MGGKGRRRREKNYIAAHGGMNRLPPPPKAKEIEALPFKLRNIMEFKSSFVTKEGATGSIAETKKGKRKDESSSKKELIAKESRTAKINAKLEDHSEDKTKNDILNGKSASAKSSLADTGRRKRKSMKDLRFEDLDMLATHSKRKSMKDLRFEDLDMLATHSKRKERKKEYLKERKNKYKKAKVDETTDFPGREDIRFGEVVEAPPKLSLPKVSKFSMDVSKERLRLLAVESYRKRRGWVSRPGTKLHQLSQTATF